MADEFKPGDAVVHQLRPDWGVGSVVSVRRVTHNGTPCQRIEARFPGGGRRTLLTGVAPLTRPEHAQSGPAAVAAPDPDAGAAPENVSVEALWALPEEMTDPFRSEVKRLEAALRFCRFGRTGGALLDWAQYQTGLRDPLTRFTRHELEEAWDRFRLNLEREMSRLIGAVSRSDPGALARMIGQAPAEVRESVRRLHTTR